MIRIDVCRVKWANTVNIYVPGITSEYDRKV